MATVKELFAKHGVENAVLESDVSALITAAESNNTGISKRRFDEVLGQRNDLRADLSEKEAELNIAQKTIETQTEEINRLQGIETEFTTMQEATNARELAKWNENKKILEVPDTDPTYEKVQKVIRKFNMGDNLTPEQVTVNNNLFDTYNEVDYFKKDDINHAETKKAGGSKKEPKNPFAKETYNLTEQILLKKRDPAEYERLKELAGK